MRVLVTGAGGFVGGHLVKALIDIGHQVFAGGIQNNCYRFDKKVDVLKFDITDYQNLIDIISKIRPDGIIHLAAQSMVQRSWEDPAYTIHVNTIGTINLIKAVKETVVDSKIINIGSSEEYGLTGKFGQALDEQSPCLPQNPYASSKFVAGQLALQLAKKDKLRLIHVRPFNHFGPGQQVGFVISDFASQIARIEKGLYPAKIYVGDLSAQRDFSDVRDIVNAYIMLLENDLENGIYNVCSGKPRTIESILKQLIQQSTSAITIEIDKERFRPSEVSMFFGSNQKLVEAVGWRPNKDFATSLSETLKWWRCHGRLAAATLIK